MASFSGLVGQLQARLKLWGLCHNKKGSLFRKPLLPSAQKVYWDGIRRVYLSETRGAFFSILVDCSLVLFLVGLAVFISISPRNLNSVRFPLTTGSTGIEIGQNSLLPNCEQWRFLLDLGRLQLRGLLDWLHSAHLGLPYLESVLQFLRLGSDLSSMMARRRPGSVGLLALLPTLHQRFRPFRSLVSRTGSGRTT